MTLGGDHDAPSSEDLGERLRILVLRRSKFAHVNECRVHGKSVHALPRLVGADRCDDPTVRSKLVLRNQRRASQ